MKKLKIDERKRDAALNAAQKNWDRQLELARFRTAVALAKKLEADKADKELKEALDQLVPFCPIKEDDQYQYWLPTGRTDTMEVTRVIARLDTMEWRVLGVSAQRHASVATSIPFPKEQE